MAQLGIETIVDRCSNIDIRLLRTSSRRCRATSGVIAVEGIAEFAGLENDGVEQEETYILHTMK